MELISFPVCIKTFRLRSPTVDFYYPMVDCLKNLKVQQKMNCKICNFVIDTISKLQYENFITYITGSYEIKTNERNVLSISLSGMGDFRGAHPININKSLNMDVKTGKVYQLKDLFKPNSDYINRLSEIGYEQIKEQNIDLYDDGFKEVKPDQDYYIADKDLIIYYQQYDIGPRPSGFPYFSVPIYQIQDIIPENGILYRLVEYF